MNNLILKPDLREDEDFVVIQDSSFEYLFRIYGGTDIRRVMIPVKATPAISRNYRKPSLIKAILEDLMQPERKRNNKFNDFDRGPGDESVIDLHIESMDEIISVSTVNVSIQSFVEIEESKFAGAQESTGEISQLVELNLRRLRILIAPNMSFFPGNSQSFEAPFAVNISRISSIGELQMKIIQALKQGNSNQNQDHPIRFLLEWSRLWKVDWSRESVKNLPKLILDCTSGGNVDAIPIEINAKHLNNNQIIDDLDIGEEEVLLFEVIY
jgi:hypothetical protein